MTQGQGPRSTPDLFNASRESCERVLPETSAYRLLYEHGDALRRPVSPRAMSATARWPADHRHAYVGHDASHTISPLRAAAIKLARLAQLGLHRQGGQATT